MTWQRWCRELSMITTARISTNTNLASFSRGGEKRKMTELIPLYAKHGWKNFDLNFCEMMNPGSELNDGRAEGYLSALLAVKEELGLGYVLSHAPYPRDSRPSEASNASILRSLFYAERLGVPVIIIHPVKGSLEENVDYFSLFLGKYQGPVRIAIENMEGDDEISDVETLLELTSALGERTGICLDTGHLHMRGGDISGFIRKAGSRLIATHIADNDGKSDQHFLPGFGTIAWEEVMAAFGESYDGYLNYECMFFSRNLPKELSGEVIDLSLKVMDWLLSLTRRP